MTQSPASGPLEVLVEVFDRDRGATREEIRRLLETDPRAFLEGLIRVLRAGTNAGGMQYAVSLLVNGDHLFGVLAHPALTREEGVSLLRTALEVDAMADVTVARRLAGESAQLTNATVSRLMEILQEASSGNRIMPSLLRLLRQPDPQIRSKAVLMIGRASRSVRWLHARLWDWDPRARANAVEALWGVETPEAKAFLRMALADSHGRVRANALLGLFRSGDCWIIPELIEMAASEQPMFRASAAWAMGETADSRFVETIRQLVCDSSAVVRKRALSALGRLKKAGAKGRGNLEWRVAARTLPPAEDSRRVSVHVEAPESGAPNLLSTQFLILEGGRTVNSYQVEERRMNDPLAVSFLLPSAGGGSSASCIQAALNCLPWKRKFDFWRVVFYRDAVAEAEPKLAPPPFSTSPEEIAAALGNPPGETECAGFWASIGAMAAANPPNRAIARWIVYCPSDPGSAEGVAETVSAALAAQVSATVIASAYSPALEGLSRRSQGRFQIVSPGAGLARILEDAYLTLRPRYTITYKPVAAEAGPVQIRVSNDEGWGETELAL